MPPRRLAVAIACGLLLVVVESRTKAPLIRIDFFRRRHYVAGAIGMALAGVNGAVFVYFYILFAQSPDGLSYTAIVAGLSLIPLSLAMFLLAVGAPHVRGMAGSTGLISAGMAVSAIGFWFAQDISSTSTFGNMWWQMALIGTGVGLGYALLPRVALSALPEEDSGQGSGVVNTCLYFGLTMGIVGGGIVSAASLRRSLMSAVQQLGLAPNEQAQLVHVLVHGAPGEIMAAFERAAASGPPDLKQATRTALESSFSDVMLTGAAVSLVGLVLMGWLLRGPSDSGVKGPANAC